MKRKWIALIVVVLVVFGIVLVAFNDLQEKNRMGVNEVLEKYSEWSDKLSQPVKENNLVSVFLVSFSCFLFLV